MIEYNTDMDEAFVKSAIDSLISGIAVFTYVPGSHTVTFEFLNDGAFLMLGTTRHAAQRIIEQNVAQMILPDDLPIVRQWLIDVVADNGDVESVFRYVTFQGSLAHMRIKGNLFERHGDVNRIVCTFSDCTEEVETREEFDKQLNLLNSVVNFQDRFDYQVRTDTCVIHRNDAQGREELIPSFRSSIGGLGIHADDQQAFTEAIDRALRSPCKDQIEYRLEEPAGSGEYRWHQCNVMSILGHEGYVAHVLGLISDIHDRKLEEERLQLRADTDSLTHLLNKGATEELIRSEIAAHHSEKHMDALMMIDVDDFKYINDHFGHMVGDKVLHFVGDALKSNLKGMDVAGRIGGDEFMVFLQNIKSAHDPETIAQHLEDVIQHDFDDREVAGHLSVSIGIAIGTELDEDYEELFKEADEALYETKNHGKASYTMYHHE